MSILGYSAAYFLPQYWSETPLYGEKIIPLLDYVLSADYQHTDKLASAFYDIENKYKNTGNLPIDKIEAIIEESGYGYIRNLLGQDEDSLRLLVYILVLVHELKGSKKGVEAVLELLRTKADALELQVVGNPTIPYSREVSGFSVDDYIIYSNFSVGNEPFELSFTIKTSAGFSQEQCIASSYDYGFYLGINEEGRIVLKIGENKNGVRNWQNIDNKTMLVSDRVLSPSTTYTIKLTFSGLDYVVDVIQDEVLKKYLIVESSQGVAITGGSIVLGVDVSTNEVKNPFLGTIALAPFTVTAKNTRITQWFETFPVDIEDTFVIDADLDVNLISEDFFVRFAQFVEKYVYPTLKAFRVRMTLKAKIVFLPWVRQKVNYIASNIGTGGYETFNVLLEDSTEDREMYGVQVPVLYAWAYNDNVIYTKSTNIYAATVLYNSDKTVYMGSEFRVEEVVGTGEVTYKITYNGHDTVQSPQDDMYGPTPFETRVDTD